MAASVHTRRPAGKAQPGARTHRRNFLEQLKVAGDEQAHEALSVPRLGRKKVLDVCKGSISQHRPQMRKNTA